MSIPLTNTSLFMKTANPKTRFTNSYFMTVTLAALLSVLCYGQVGINTANPKGALDISSVNNTGLVLPRVSSIEAVTDGTIHLPINATTVYDLSRNSTCFYINNDWTCIENDSNGNPLLTQPLKPEIDYIKASNTEEGDAFGISIAISENGNTLAVGSTYERSNATGVNGNQNNNADPISGAVYIFVRTAATWMQQAYIKASNTESFDVFGWSLSLTDDGYTLAVSAIGEDSNATGINGNQTDNAIIDSGAVYLFNRTGTNWTQEAYIKSSNPNDNDNFGYSVVLSGNGNTLAVGALQEDSNATGINGDQTNNAAVGSGAVYVFVKVSNIWSQQAYIKASNTGTSDRFGEFIDLSYDGNTLVAGAGGESSSSTGINGNQASNTAQFSGAAYVFERVGINWSQQAYIKASNTQAYDHFGGVSNTYTIAFGRLGDNITLSSDGNTLVISATAEDSLATGVNGAQNNDLDVNQNYGAVYVFVRSGSLWTQQGYLKASNPDVVDYFGATLSLSNDGNVLAVSALCEKSNATGINGNQADNSIDFSGSVYLFKRVGTMWLQTAYVKTTNTGIDPWTAWGDNIGYALGLSGDGKTLALGAPAEDSDALGINGNQSDNSLMDAGAVFTYTFN